MQSIRRHPVRGWVLITLWLFVASGGVLGTLDKPHGTWFVWVAVAYFALAPLGVALALKGVLTRKSSRSSELQPMFVIVYSILPWPVGSVASLMSGYHWPMWVAFGESAILLAIGLRSTAISLEGPAGA